MDAQLGKLMVLPALIVLGILLTYDRKFMLLLIILFRSAGDIFLESTRFSLGSYQVGVGGLINAFVILIALLLMLEKPKAVPKQCITMWAGFLLIVLYGVMVSPVKSEAIRTWLSLVSCFAIFVGAFHFVKTKEDFQFCIKLVLWSSVLPVMYAFVDIALNHARGGVDGFRLQSTFSHANIFAFYLTLLITLAFYMLKSMAISSSSRTRVWLIPYIFLLLGLLILTKTRSAWLACFFGFALYAMFFERRYLFYLISIPIIGLFIPGVAERIADLGHGNEIINYSRLNSFAWRVSLWESALRWTKPGDYLLGHGLQSFREYSIVFFPLAGRTNFGAHNVYVQWLFELGAVGCSAYLWLHYKVLRELKAMLQFDRLGAFFLIVVVLNYLICALSDNMLDYLSFNWYLWFVIGAGCAFVRISTTNTRGVQ
ncbi:MAG: O-antigen ligase family protein [Burkholderiaceae bacterium]